MIKTYEEAIEVLGIKHFDEKGLTPDEIAYKKLKVITKVLNDGWKADWSDSEQHKYAPWFNTSDGFKFFDESYECVYLCTGYTSTLCFRDRKTAEYTGKQFIDLYKTFIL